MMRKPETRDDFESRIFDYRYFFPDYYNSPEDCTGVSRPPLYSVCAAISAAFEVAGLMARRKKI
jgi:hypothetical protein